MRALLLPILALSAASLLPACAGGGKTDGEKKALSTDTLRVATLYSPTSYFIYRDQKMGYDYELASAFAESEKRPLKLLVASNMQSMLEMLKNKEVDLVAYDVPMTAEYNSEVLHCGPEEITTQVLVQENSDSLITDVTQLAGHTVMVEKGSKFQQRMENLSRELGGVIDVQTLERDTLMTEDFITMVSNGEIELTVVDSQTASLNRSYFPKLDMSLQVGLPQKASWAVRPDEKELAERINKWYSLQANKEHNADLHKKYFELSKNEFSHFDTTGIELGDGRISLYDDSFKRSGKDTGWDWRLLAAIGFTESRFKANARSWVGARGIMQIMPKTGAALGLKPNQLENPDASINAAARYLTKLDNSLKDKIPDSNERLKFVIASYNGGIGHVYDSMALAEKYGKNPTVWEDNVSSAVLMKSKPKYYNDPVVKCGYFRGRETVDYVDRVLNAYFYYKKNFKA